MKKILSSFALIAFLAILIVPSFVSAQFGGTIPNTETPSENFQSIGSFMGWVRTILGYLITAFWILTVVMLLYAAYLYVTSGGDEDATKKAKDYLMYGLIGAGVALLSTGLKGLAGNVLSGQ